MDRLLTFQIHTKGRQNVVGCPETFGPIGGGGCYHPVLSGSGRNWTEAVEVCKSLNCRANSLRLETDQVQIYILILIFVLINKIRSFFQFHDEPN